MLSESTEVRVSSSKLMTWLLQNGTCYAHDSYCVLMSLILAWEWYLWFIIALILSYLSVSNFVILTLWNVVSRPRRLVFSGKELCSREYSRGLAVSSSGSESGHALPFAGCPVWNCVSSTSRVGCGRKPGEPWAKGKLAPQVECIRANCFIFARVVFAWIIFGWIVFGE